MIVPMKKITLLVEQKESVDAVSALRQLGVMHLEHIRQPKGSDINLLQEDLALAGRALEILSEKDFIIPELIEKKQKYDDWKTACRHIIDLRKRYSQLEDYSQALLGQIKFWQGWGDFEPEKIQALAGKNIFVRLYQIPIKEIDNLPKNAVVKNISVENGIANCAIFSLDKVTLGYKEVALPKTSLKGITRRRLEDQALMDDIRKELSRLSGLIPDLKQVHLGLEENLEFSRAVMGMGSAGQISYLSGYVPFNQEKLIRDLARQRKWAAVFSLPSQEDNTPVLLKNPKWVSLINPVFKLMEVVPGYRELDVSPVFLLFLALFFGMIISDAGYGSVYFLLTFLAQRKLGAKVKDHTVFKLFYLFSFCAILWGALSGVIFGQEWFLAKGFKPLLPVLNDSKFLMSFCFFLGALQLSLGHGWQAIVKLPSLSALADIGFICLLWAGFLLARMFIVSAAFPDFGKWLIWSGILLILFFSNPQRNILKGIGSGAGTLALNLMGNFGDVVSYIRLFAVGLAGIAVSDSVNALAASAGGNLIAQILIVFIGHTINIVLGPISVLVHGVRLNVLEFSLLHGNVTWSGLAYKPLKKQG